MIKVIAAVLFGLLLALYEVSVVSFLPPWLGFRPLLPFCVILIVSSTRSRALAAAIIGGLVLDAYALGSFDLAFVRFPLIILILAFAARRFLTNRSVYATAALAAIARLLDWASAAAISAGAVFLNVSDTFWSFPPAPAAVLFWDVTITAVAFLLVASFTGRFITRPGSPYVSR